MPDVIEIRESQKRKKIQRRIVEFSCSQDYISGIGSEFDASCEFHRSNENRVPVLIEKRGIVRVSCRFGRISIVVVDFSLGSISTSSLERGFRFRWRPKDPVPDLRHVLATWALWFALSRNVSRKAGAIFDQFGISNLPYLNQRWNKALFLLVSSCITCFYSFSSLFPFYTIYLYH